MANREASTETLEVPAQSQRAISSEDMPSSPSAMAVPSPEQEVEEEVLDMPAQDTPAEATVKQPTTAAEWGKWIDQVWPEETC